MEALAVLAAVVVVVVLVAVTAVLKEKGCPKLKIFIPTPLAHHLPPLLEQLLCRQEQLHRRGEPSPWCRWRFFLLSRLLSRLLLRTRK